MNRLLGTVACALALALLTTSAATASSQDPPKPVLTFTSICAVPGYVDFGFCNGNPATFSNVNGTVGQSQARRGHWVIRLTFTGLTTGASYRLWGNRDGLAIPGKIDGFFPIATGRALFGGVLWFDVDTTNPENLAFDLNQLTSPSDTNGTTIVTSYWSKQFLHVNADQTLSAG